MRGVDADQLGQALALVVAIEQRLRRTERVVACPRAVQEREVLLGPLVHGILVVGQVEQIALLFASPRRSITGRQVDKENDVE